MGRKISVAQGAQFGEVTVIEELEPHITPNGTKQRIVRCRCSCGNEYTTRLTAVHKNGKCQKCLMADKRVDITGRRFGKLVVLSMASDYVSPQGHRLSRCNCHCDCGKDVTVNMSALVTGTTRSCGCISNTSGLLKDNTMLMEKYDQEKNQNLNLGLLTARSNKKAWRKCKDCGNSWFATIASQNDKIKHGCPYCSGRLPIEGKTDLLAVYPEIVEKWWDYEKNTITPNKISSSSTQKVWWKCEEGHSWKANVANKVRGSGCPRCNMENTNSFCEQALFYYVRKAFPDAINGDHSTGMELDIMIPSLKVALEYDGEAWHGSKRKTEIDNRKNKYCSELGITLIRVREPRLKEIDSCVVFVREDSTSNESLDTVIQKVLHYLRIDNIVVDTLKDTSAILEQYALSKKQNSLAYIYPDVAAEWHPSKNGNLTPDKVNKSAQYKVWWLGKCGHEWQMSVSDRTVEFIRKNGKKKNRYGCPYCSGKRILRGFNDLESQRPDIAKEWNYEKNSPLNPDEVFVNSNKKYWWKCANGHEWESSPNRRNTNSGKCPWCYWNKRSPAVVCVETGQLFENSKSAAEFFGIKQSAAIYACCRGKVKTVGGYHWEYYVKNTEQGE